jgi:CRP-like cAMP-binding protein
MLREGKVDLTYVIHSRSPVTIKIALIQPGEVFGWSVLAGNAHLTADAHTVCDSSVYLVPGRKLIEIMEGDPASGYRIMSRLVQVTAKRLHDLRAEVRWFLSSL